ncbi:hypothetical protein ROE7235_03012 [Roseibaca ekhonensis]|uniref:Uncharacterized protein n=1 Tax=Roseinatronobacter ekhonensis TaxID=254356 RepID=A0A3B0MC59_9RHOB|nr:hypothetical protein [Roseibaca ekhonensis]SUZ33243.1 hypothetical protein ROE7235_03012 [Roseibaca ekhonensis]
MTAMTTIRINHDALPREFDASRPDIVAEIIQTALRGGGIKADASDVITHIRIDIPTVQLTAACTILTELKLLRLALQ